VIVVELREDKLSKTDKQLLTQVKEDPSARDDLDAGMAPMSTTFIELRGGAERQAEGDYGA
jgi:hypothetical protein